MNRSNPIRAMGLHSLLYCERLHYFEEVEGITIADERVYAGRTLHAQIAEQEFQDSDTLEYTSERLNLTGKMDRLLKRDGHWIPYEYKKGRSRLVNGASEAWDSDAVQVGAYALLLEEATGREVEEARIRYNADNRLVKVRVDAELRSRVSRALLRAEELQAHNVRPPIAENSRLCLHCSLAPVCLPEENRVSERGEKEAVRLFPQGRDKQTLHISSYNARVGKKGEALSIELPDENGQPRAEVIPVQSIESVTLHGSAQMSSQVLTFLSRSGVPVHWFTGGGTYVGTLSNTSLALQRRIRQFQALLESDLRLKLSKKIVVAKCETQIRYNLRSTRGSRREEVSLRLNRMRTLLSRAAHADSAASLRGIEGGVARHYFRLLPMMLSARVDPAFLPVGRTRRPPADPFNAILSFLYSLLYKSVFQAVVAVGLDPAFGLYHTPRSSGMPLVLDLMEIFRVPICDIALIGSINRLAWSLTEDFMITKRKVWLSDAGRRKAIGLYENRLEDKWKHPLLGYSLTYYRLIELEVRLLEKEWTDDADLFARARLR